MNRGDQNPSIDEVLEAFALEVSHDKATLSRYMSAYPEFAGELIDLTRELGRLPDAALQPLSESDAELVERARKRFAETRSTADVLSAMPLIEQRRLAEALDVPRQVITAFRERKVKPETIAEPFLRGFAALLNQTSDSLRALLANASHPGLARSYKSNRKPDSEGQVSFEELLIEAGVPEQRRAELLAEDD